ncbi:MAG: hypothetical protein Ct9H300mP8_10720 [Gammaproteobacteria bacterium]|nr:MAG: hypothetical protein Ct9H300mP8_10720 [Gammaproteobacteria bacterium]
MAEAHDLKVVGTDQYVLTVWRKSPAGQFWCRPTLARHDPWQGVTEPARHARVKSVDVSGALAMEGVLAAVSGGDFAEQTDDLGRNVIARDKVLYHGHAVAAVAATSPLLAEQAWTRSKSITTYSSPGLSIDQAIADGATLVKEEMHTNGDALQPASNIAAIPSLSAEILSRDLLKPTSLWRASTEFRWPPKGISNRTLVRRLLTKRARLRFGVLPKDTLMFEHKRRRYLARALAKSKLSRLKSAVVLGQIKCLP